jgi:osmotically-inducible protein OsmY
MIKGISNAGKYLQVSGGGTSSLYMNSFSGQSMVGNMRYNPSSQNVEVYDGNTWLTMPSTYSTISLTGEAEALLDWARDQRNKQWEREALAKKHPAIAAAVEAVKRAEEQLEVTVILSKDEEQTTS